MELALSLGNRGVGESSTASVGFCMGLSPSTNSIAAPRSTAEKASSDDHQKMIIKEDDPADQDEKREKVGSSSSSDPTAVVSPRQLDLLPFSPVPLSAQPPLRFPWLSDNLSSEPGSSDGPGSRIIDVNRRAAAAATVEEQSSPNSGTSSFMEFSLYTNGGGKRSGEHSNNNNNNNNSSKDENINYVGGLNGGGSGEQMTASRGSDDDENGSSRKKLRLSKDQSAFLEESFKEHHTLNPKQKLALAKQLNLRPRQVEVWFQNRRARTKLKQTEVDCEYLKRCCETLTDENRRLQKELQELRALKTSQPFFMQLPATTLTMCPSCERVAPTSASTPAGSAPPNTTVTIASKPTVSGVASGTTMASTGIATTTTTTTTTLSLGKPKQSMLPFSNNAQAHQAAS